MTTPARAWISVERTEQINFVFLLAMLAVIAGILSAAMVMQYVYGELPCPLCLLKRVALFGVAFGIIANRRGGFS